MNSYKKLVNNTVIYSIGNFSSKFIALLMLPFYTSALSKEEFGQIDVIITTLSLIIPILTANVVEAVIRFSLDKKNYTYSIVISNGLVFILLGVLILLIAYPVLMMFNVIGKYVFLFYLLFLLQSLSTLVKQFARSINLVKTFMLSDIGYSVFFVLFNIVFIFFIDLGVTGYLLSMIFASLFDLIYLVIKTKLFIYIELNTVKFVTLNKMFIYCLPLIPNSLMWWIMGISDRYFLTHYLGLGATGLYAVANKFPTIVSSFSSVFFKAWQISSVEEYEKSKASSFHSNVFNIYFFTVILIGSVFIILNKLITSLLVAEEFFMVWKYIPILIMGVIFSSFSSFIGTNYIAAKKNKGAFYTALIGALINLFLNFLLIPKIGVYGACMSTAFSFAIVWILRMVDTQKFVKMKYSFWRMNTSICLIIAQIATGFIFKGFSFYLVNTLILMLLIAISYKFAKPVITRVFNNISRKIA